MDNFKAIGDVAKSVLENLEEKKKVQLNNLQDVVDALELAARVDVALPPVKVQGAKALWPDIPLSEAEKKTLSLINAQGKPMFLPSQKQIDLWEMVCAEWITYFQTPEKIQQWKIIWLRSCGCRSKTIQRHTHCGRTKIWYLYDRGMAHLLNCLRVPYEEGDFKKVQPYRPENIPSYRPQKISQSEKIKFLKEWLAELEQR